MNEGSTTKISEFEIPSINEKIINIPGESFKEEIPIELEKVENKSSWFSFKRHQESKKQEQTIVNEIVNLSYYVI